MLKEDIQRARTIYVRGNCDWEARLCGEYRNNNNTYIYIYSLYTRTIPISSTTLALKAAILQLAL